jgi:hypothetical protein
MGWDSPDVYYQSDKFDLEIVAEVEWSAPCYDFDLTVVWVDKEGTYYWASDSGCSCPSPFEDYNSLDSLDRGTKWEAISYLTETMKTHYNGQSDYATQQVANAMQKLAGRP